jgi:hypothetical protein
MANSVGFITYLLSRGGSSFEVRPPADKLRRANESEYLGENFLFETTLGNYSETNQKQILRGAI